MPKQKGSIDLKTSGYLYGQISSLESQVDGQIQTWAQDTNPASNWSADEKASRVGDLWLFTGTSDNTTIQQGLTLHPQGIYKYVYDSVNSVYKWEAHSSTNNNIFDLADGKKKVFYGNDTPTNAEENDLWVQGSGGDIKVYRNGSWVLASKYTDDNALITWVASTYATDKGNLQDQIDGKAETWYQSSDPENNWSSTEKPKHEGDLWYNTTDGTTWYYAKQGTDPETYDWEQQNVPDAVFDKIDGKKDIHYTNNAPIHPPYNAGDLWSNGIDLRICITPKAEGENYNISDWVLASNYIDSADATSIASTEANKTKTTETKTLYYISTSSNEPTGGSWVDETTITTADVLNKYLFVKIQNKINGSWVDATPSPGWQKSNLYNGIYTFANTVAGDSGLTTINGSKITTGRIQDSTGKNFIQIANDGTTTAGHLEFKDTSSWSTANQGIQWNSSQGQLNIKGHITAKSLTIDGTGGSYNAYDAINISGYSIEITTNDGASDASSISSNNVYLYPHLYHNGSEVFYVLTDDTTPQNNKIYYSYDGTTYTAYSPAPSNPKSVGAYESVASKFIWYLNGSSIGTSGDSSHGGRILATYSDTAKVIYTFNDGATDGGTSSVTVNVDPSKYITRISDTGIEVAPEIKTGNNKLAINTGSIDIYKNNVSMLHLENSAGRFGNTIDYTKVSSTNGIEIYRNSIKRAQFDSDVNLYSSDQLQRLNLNTGGLHLYNGNDEIARFGSSTFISGDGGSISIDTSGSNSSIVLKNPDGQTSFGIYSSLGSISGTDANYTEINNRVYIRGLEFLKGINSYWPLNDYLCPTSTSTLLNLYIDPNRISTVKIEPFQSGTKDRCSISGNSFILCFGRWVFLQIYCTIGDVTLSANDTWAIVKNAPVPYTSVCAIAASSPGKKNSALSGYINDSGNVCVNTDDVALVSGDHVAFTGWYLGRGANNDASTPEFDPPDYIFAT